MKHVLVLTLLIAPLVDAFSDPASDKFDLRYPGKEHMTALELYQLGNTATAIRKIAGQFVLLDVVVTIERDVPVVEIVKPKGLTGNPAVSPSVIHASLISVTTAASSLKKGQRLRIEGVIVDEGYGAYMIYLIQARPIK